MALASLFPRFLDLESVLNGEQRNRIHEVFRKSLKQSKEGNYDVLTTENFLMSPSSPPSLKWASSGLVKMQGE